VTTATDVYALGLVLFVLLVGRHPLDPGNKTPAELIHLTLDSDVPRLSEVASDAKHARLLRGDLDNVIATALRRKAADRYTTAELFAQDLRRYLALEPVAARPHSLRYLAAKFMRRHRVSVGAGIAIALVLIGAVITTTAEMLEARQQRDRARYQTRQAEDSKEFLSLLMLSGFSSGRPARTFRDRVEFGVEMLNKQYRGNPKFSGRMLVEMAVGFRDNQETARADELYQQAYDIGRVNHDVELMAYAQCSRAYGDGYANMQKDVMGRLAEAQRLLQQIHDANEDLQATCVMAQSMVEQRLGHSASAEALMRQEKRRLELNGSTYRQIYVEVVEGLGEVYLARNQLRDALQIDQLAGRVLDRSGRGATSARLVARQNVAVLLSAMGESRAALAEREIINRDAADVEGPGEEPIPYAINYARVLLIMARPAAALKALDGMPERARSTQNRFMLANILLAVGSAHLQLHRWVEADAALKEAASVVADGTGSRHVSAQVEAELAQLDLMRGEHESADRHRDRSLELAGYHGQQPERCLAKILLAAGQMALAEGAPTQAERFAHDALAISDLVARGADTSADVGEALLRLAQARLASGSKAEIQPLLERAVRCLTNGLGANHPLTVEARTLLIARREQVHESAYIPETLRAMHEGI
ncbi:MAG: eukaryotic-like serine/threonine-protein kinase, partial [Betaproteobacteria bacterium]